MDAAWCLGGHGAAEETGNKGADSKESTDSARHKSTVIYRAHGYYGEVGSIRFSGVSFQIYTHDYLPRHVHARYAGVTVIIELGTSGVRVSRRADRIEPRKAKRSDVAYMLKVARVQQEELNRLWEETHGDES